jgi:hypothetical protein
MDDEYPIKKRRSRGEDYVNNKEFSQALYEHVTGVKEDVAAGKEPRPLTNYIGECFLKICYGLSKSPNFVKYTYRDDMVMDAVENCIKAANNYDFDAPTRTGSANAFSYFTQISYYAFLRRIAKEKKQTTIKQALIEHGSIGNFAEFDENSDNGNESMIEKMRQKNDAFYNYDNEEQSLKANEKPKKVDKRKHHSAREGLLDKFLES